jgi:5-methylcytosine-specific restriction endonuclease McrA
MSQAETKPRKLDILSEQQGHRCCYCGVRFPDPPDGIRHKRGKRRWRELLPTEVQMRMATIEHVVRRTDGGPLTWENEVAACTRCNTRRGEMDAFIYFRTRQQGWLSDFRTRSERKRSKRKRRAIVKAWKAEQNKPTLRDVWPGSVEA